MKINSRRAFLKSGIVLAAGTATAASSIAGIGRSSDQAFFEAVATGDAQRVKRMLSERRALLGLHDVQGRSAYSIALLAGHATIAELLIKEGYESDLHEAVLGLDWDRFELLATDLGPDVVEVVNQWHPIGGSALHAAAAGGAGTALWRVLAKCCVPDTHDQRNDITAVQLALRHRNLEAAEVTAFALLSNSAGPNAAGTLDSSALHIAAERGSHDIVEMLVRLGANIEAKDRSGNTSLEIARANKHTSVMELLENQRETPRTNQTFRDAYSAGGQRYQRPDMGGISDLEQTNFVMTSHSDISAVKAGIKRDPRLIHSVAVATKERAIEAPTHLGNKPIVQLLLDGGAPYSLPTAVMMNDIETTKRYLDEAPDRIHERGPHDMPLLYYPIFGRCGVEILQLLLDRGANIEQQSIMGSTSLHVACMRGDVDAVRLLIDRGANVTRIGRKFGGTRQTPLQHSRAPMIIEMLRSGGA